MKSTPRERGREGGGSVRNARPRGRFHEREEKRRIEGGEIKIAFLIPYLDRVAA